MSQTFSRRAILEWMCGLLVAGSLAQAAEPGVWQRISDNILKEVGAYDLPRFARRNQAMVVDPATGHLFILHDKKGIVMTADQGETWSKIEASLSGRAETGFSLSAAYPADGRLAMITIDGLSGLTLDGGKTWKAFGRHHRGFDSAAIDWSAADPQTIFAVEHEPWFRVLSTDGGKTWKRLNEEADQADDLKRDHRVGVVNANTLLWADSARGGIKLSTDLGKTWEKVSDLRVLGNAAVRYGNNLYWAGSRGILRSADGRDWKLAGTELPNATWGPFFGKSEAEMMAVTDRGFFLTRDGGENWKQVAPYFAPPDDLPARKYDMQSILQTFAWDPVNHVLYAAYTADAVYRMKLPRD